VEAFIGTICENTNLMTIRGKQGEILRFENNGDIFVHGNLVENDAQVVSAFREFLTEQGLLR